MSTSALEWLRADSPDAAALAALASVAARVDRAVLRTLRLEALSGADATAEADLWFSDLVALRTSEEIVLRSDALEALRADLVRMERIDAACGIVRSLHANASPLLSLEEDLIALGVTGGDVAEIERRLGEALATLREHSDRARDVAGWALTALPRLPARVRATAAAWSLAFAAQARSGYAIAMGGDAPRAGIILEGSTPNTTVRVARDGEHLVFEGTDGPALSVPDTTPRVVVVEHGGTSTVAAIEAGKPFRVAVGADDVTLVDLRGTRWRVRTGAAFAPAYATSSEKGRWILLDGSDHQTSLPPEHAAVAIAVGEALARAGFSLVTLGLPGVAYVGAAAFATTMQARGYSSGIYCLLHIVPEGSAPDYASHGRVLPTAVRSSIVEAAVDRADAVLCIGTSAWSAVLEKAAMSAGRPFAPLIGPVGSSPSPLPQLLDPSTWSSSVLARFVDDLVERLTARFPSPDDAEVPADLVHLAGTALDARELEDYNRILGLIEGRAPSVVSSRVAARLVTDTRPSHRLVGYCAFEPRESLNTLAQALLAERRTMRQFWETRTLSLALDALDRVEWRGEDPQLRAIAASAGLIERELDTDLRIDRGGECRALLSRATPPNVWTNRARALVQAAIEYEAIRAPERSGLARTRRMENVLHRIRSDARPGAHAEATIWHAGGYPGERIVALALLLGDPDPKSFPIVEDVITRPLSPFEQYAAFRAADAMLDRLDAPSQRHLKELLEQQRRELRYGRDTDRFNLSGAILERLEQRRRVDFVSHTSDPEVVVIFIEELDYIDVHETNVQIDVIFIEELKYIDVRDKDVPFSGVKQAYETRQMVMLPPLL